MTGHCVIRSYARPYRPVLGAVARIVLARAELAAYVQALQSWADAPPTRITDCKRLNVVLRDMKRHKCGLGSVISKQPLKFVVCIDAAFKAQPEGASGLVVRGLAATLCEDRGGGESRMVTTLRLTSSISLFVGKGVLLDLLLV